jgi:hypothetical protein
VPFRLSQILFELSFLEEMELMEQSSHASTSCGCVWQERVWTQTGPAWQMISILAFTSSLFFVHSSRDINLVPNFGSIACILETPSCHQLLHGRPRKRARTKAWAEFLRHHMSVAGAATPTPDHAETCQVDKSGWSIRLFGDTKLVGNCSTIGPACIFQGHDIMLHRVIWKTPQA